MNPSRDTRDMAALVAVVARLNDRELIANLTASVQRHREATANLLIHIGEVDARRLYRGEACSSMFAYCVERLLMSEPAAFRHIHAARVARRFPQLLTMVAAGDLHLSGIKLLAAHLTEENCSSLLAEARHASKRNIEQMVARRFPGVPVPDAIRRVSRGEVKPIVASQVSRGGSTQRTTMKANAATPLEAPRLFIPSAEPPTPESKPEATEERYAISFTASRELHDKLRQAQELLLHTKPANDLAKVFDRALTLLLEDLHRKRFGRRKRKAVGSAAQGAKAVVPAGVEKARSRHVPSSVKRGVVERDGLRCAFVDAHGHRCSATGFLQLHHQHAFAKGGGHSVDNVTVYCGTHNQYIAELELGDRGVNP